MPDPVETKPAYEALVSKPISTRNVEFTEWLVENTGYDVDPRSVALSSNLRNVYLASPEYKANAEARDKAKAAAEIDSLRKAAAAAEKRDAALKAKLAKAEALLAAEAVEDEPEEVEEIDDPELPVEDEPEPEEESADVIVEEIKARRKAAVKATPATAVRRRVTRKA